MANEGAVVLLVIFLAIYISVLLLGLTRIRLLKEFSGKERSAKAFFICMLIFLSLRVLGLGAVAIALDTIDYQVSFLILEIPTVFLVIPAIYLGIIKFEKTYQAHIVSNLSVNFLSTDSVQKRFSKIRPLMTVFLIFYLVFSVLLMLFFAVGVLSGSAVESIVAGFNIAIGFGIILEIILLHAQFSGVPAKSTIWTARLRRINTIAILWAIGKLTLGFFDIFRVVSEESEVKSIYKDDYQILELCLNILLIFFTEVLNIIATFDYAFVSIFVSDSDEIVQLPNRERVSSMIGINPYVNSSDITVKEELHTKPNNLGKIFKALYLFQPVVYRLIVLSNISAYVIEEIQAEMESYKTCFIIGVVRIAAIVIEQSSVGLVYPFYKNQSLFHVLHIEKYHFTYPEKIKILQKAAEILSNIHKEQKVHGHLTSHNILMESDYQPAITDLGFHKLKKYAGLKSNYTYKSAWSSPEVLGDMRQIPKVLKCSSDIYSFGMICWEVLSGQEPFPGYSLEKVRKTVVDEGVRPKIPGELSDGIAKLIQSCFNSDCSTRPDACLIVSSLK